MNESSFLNKIIHGDCLNLIKNLDDNSIDCMITDPPFGENMSYANDANIEEAEELLYEMLSLSYSKMKFNSHLAIFFTFRHLDRAIEAIKDAGFVYKRCAVMYLKQGNSRPYLCFIPRSFPIIIAQKYIKPEMHKEFSKMLEEKLQQSGMNKNQLAKIMGCDSRLIKKWLDFNDKAGKVLVTPRFYPKLKELFAIEDKWDVLLEREPNSARKKLWEDQKFYHDVFIIDDRADKETKGHPSPKPLSVIEKLVVGMCKPDGIVLDCFMGSGTTAVACKKNGRNFIGFEISEEYCKIAEDRLSKLDNI